MAREGFCSKATNGKGSFLGVNKPSTISKSSMTNDELLSMLGIENKAEERNVLGKKPAFYNDIYGYDNTLGNMLWRYSVILCLQICLEVFCPYRPPRAPNHTYLPP